MSQKDSKISLNHLGSSSIGSFGQSSNESSSKSPDPINIDDIGTPVGSFSKSSNESPPTDTKVSPVGSFSQSSNESSKSPINIDKIISPVGSFSQSSNESSKSPDPINIDKIISPVGSLPSLEEESKTPEKELTFSKKVSKKPVKSKKPEGWLKHSKYGPIPQYTLSKVIHDGVIYHKQDSYIYTYPEGEFWGHVDENGTITQHNESVNDSPKYKNIIIRNEEDIIKSPVEDPVYGIIPRSVKKRWDSAEKKKKKNVSRKKKIPVRTHTKKKKKMKKMKKMKKIKPQTKTQKIKALEKELAALKKTKKVKKMKVKKMKVKKKDKTDKTDKKTKVKMKVKKKVKKVNKVFDEDIIDTLGKKCPKGYKKNKKTGKCHKNINVTKTCSSLIGELEGIVDKLTIEEGKYNEILKCISDRNREDIREDYAFLYPLLDDANFNNKIAIKKEFFDTKYQKREDSDWDNIEEITNSLCKDRDFELSPHQKFVRNFLSFKTPYNSLLLFHGLGSGKTCSAISVCEEMRVYSKQLKNTKRIIIVASPNVQENFKLQLFDERKLRNVDDNWNIKSCTGNLFIKEINPMNMKGLSRDKVIRQIKRIINNSYVFLGYIQFATFISRIMTKHLRDDLKQEEMTLRGLKYIKKEFSNRMIVIDEVQNIRNTEDSALKKTSENLLKLVKYTDDMKLLLLSATPMFNDPKEVVWLLNLMNVNDDRYSIKENDIFDKEGNLKRSKDGEEIGKELLIRKSTGYVSYVRGENPFTFPFRLFPDNFESPHSIKKIMRDSPNWYPKEQINSTIIIEPINILDIFVTKLGVYQHTIYMSLITYLKSTLPILNNPKKGIQYTVLDGPIQVLNMVYPMVTLPTKWSKKSKKKVYGGGGLKNCMEFALKTKNRFKYKKEILNKFGRIFSPGEILKYSGKIASVCNTIKKSKGIILVYSQFIDGGCIPLALALEEMGFSRYGGKSLFKDSEVEPIDAITMKPREENKRFQQANYIMITGDPKLSPDNTFELDMCTNDNNTHGEIVKVVIISRAGSEGLDFKNIRQVHILEPWYNFNRIEQTIGRGVRNLSHCLLPFNERNVEIYLYGSELEDNSVEPVDLYMYRLSERKAKKIGVISRVLKENAVDCLLNKSYNMIDFDKNIDLLTSTGTKITYNLRDKPFTSLCDFLDNCECSCIPEDIEIDEDDVKKDTYDETFILMNIDKILHRIRMLFKEKYVYEKMEMLASINASKFYPREQIYMALNQLIEDDNEFITDMLGRIGKLVVTGEFYMFQPIEIDNTDISLFERTVPLDYKRKKLEFLLPEQFLGQNEKHKEQHSEKRKEKHSEKRKEQHSEKDQSIDYSTIYKGLKDKFETIESVPDLLDETNKKIWESNACWTIWNLNKFNTELDRNILIVCAFEHFLDLLSYNEKVVIINTIYFKDLDRIETIIKKYFDRLIIHDGENISIVLLNNLSNPPIKYLRKTTSNWDDDIRGLTQNNILKTMEMFEHVKKITDKNFEIGNLNINIGFMIFSKRYGIIFKNKSVKMDGNKRVKKGSACVYGTKVNLTAKINELLDKPVKYKLGNVQGKKNMDIIEIYTYSGDDIKFYQLDDTGKQLKGLTPVKLNILQLCIEIELIHRYYHKTKKNGKIWFLSELETYINKIENVGI